MIFNKTWFWVFLLLVCFQFFMCLYIPITGAVSKAVMLLIGILPMFLLWRKKIPLSIAFKVMLLGVVLSCVSGSFYRDQTFIQTFLASFVVYGCFSYFLYWKTDLKITQAEKILMILALIYSLSYLIQYIIYPTLIFNTQSMSDNVYNSRLRLQGTALSSIGFCLYFNKYINGENNKTKYAIFTVICVLPLILMGFRTMLVAIIACLLYMVYMIKGFKLKIMLPAFVLIGLFVVVFLNSKTGQNILSDIAERQQTDNFGNEDYVRMIGLDYYMNEYFKDNIEFMLGSGMYYAESAGEKLQQNIDPFGIKWNDWGLLGLSFYSGIITVVSIFYIVVRSVLIKVTKEYLYLKAWLVFMLLCSITTAEFLRLGNTVILALVIYMIMKEQYKSNQHDKSFYNSTRL